MAEKKIRERYWTKRDLMCAFFRGVVFKYLACRTFELKADGSTLITVLVLFLGQQTLPRASPWKVNIY